MKDQTHVDTTNQPASELTHISLCAGYGGIDLGLHRVFGQKLRTIAFSEIEAFAVENLLAKMEAGLLPAAPVWTDLRTFPWADFQGVDLLSGGFPCQPFSAAGKRNADSDPRHLFPAIIEGIRHAKPGIVFLENVEGIVSAKLAGDDWRDPAGTPVLLHVLRELERVGYKATAGIFSASEVGAPHQRKRIFILAYRKCAGLEGLDKWDTSSEQTELVGADFGSSCQRSAWPSRPSEPQHAWDAGRMADTNDQHGHGEERGGNPETQGVPSEHWQEEHSRWQFGRADAEGHQAWPSRPGEPQHEWEPPRVVGNATHTNRRPRVSAEEAGAGPDDIRRWLPKEPSSGFVANGEELRMEGWQHDNPGRCGSRGGAFQSSRRSGQGVGHECQTQPPLGRDADGNSDWLGYAELCISCDNRTDELRLLGNGVVPATAERAFVTLMQELTK